MRIDTLSVFHVAMPLIDPWKTSFGEMTAVDSVLVRLTSGDEEGWGEAAPYAMPQFCPEWAAGCFQLIAGTFRPLLLGKAFSSGAELQACLGSFKGNHFAKAAIDLAWWDLFTRLGEQPLWRAIGGQNPSIAVGADIPVQPDRAALLGSVAAALDAGYPRVKLKFRPDSGVGMVAAVREAFPDIRLRLHEAYSGEIQTLLADGRIDVGTLNRYRPLRREPHDAVLTSPMSLIVRAEAPASRGGRSVTFAAAAALPLVMPLKPNGLRGVVEEIAARRRLVLTVALEVGSSTAMKDAVRCGLAATLPAHAVRDETARGEFRALLITHPTIRQTTFVETTRRRPASAAVREVERLLRKLVPTLGPP